VNIISLLDYVILFLNLIGRYNITSRFRKKM